MSDHVVNDQNETCNIQCNDDKPRFTPRFTSHILRKRFALTRTCYSFLDIAINVGLKSHVEIMLRNRNCDRRYQIILPHKTWIAFIKERKNVKQFLQSPIGSSLSICDLVLKLVELPDDETLNLFTAVKLTVHGDHINIIPKTLLKLFEIEKHVEDEYFELCQYTDSVSEKYKHFVNNIKSRGITNKYEAIDIIFQDYDKNSLIDNELLIYAVDNILYDAFKDAPAIQS